MKLSTLSTLSAVTLLALTAAACDPSDNLADKQMSELTDDEFLEFCEGFEAELDADTIEGQRRADCLATVDCEASATAVEDCAAASDDPVLECDVPGPDDPERACELTVAEVDACMHVFIGQVAAWADVTCATDPTDYPAFQDITEFPECDIVVETCPELFEVDQQAAR
jgi:hypothetical protein